MNQRKLLQLLAQNAGPNAMADRPAPRVEADSAHLYLDTVIDPYWGYSDALLRQDLDAAGGRPVQLHINTPGGDVFEALAMAATLAAYRGGVTAKIAGVCASSGTRVALACANVQITDGSLFMVHNAWTLAMGNAAEMRTTADLLDKVDQGIAQDYARKSGATLDQVTAWMAAETWFTAAEAKAAGLVDEVVTAQAAQTAQAAGRWNLSAFSNAPRISAPPPPGPDAAAMAATAAAQARLARARLAALGPVQPNPTGR